MIYCESILKASCEEILPFIKHGTMKISMPDIKRNINICVVVIGIANFTKEKNLPDCYRFEGLILKEKD